MSSASAAPTGEENGEEQETRECATCGEPLTEYTWGDFERRDYKCENGHGGHIAPDGTRQGPAFERTGVRYLPDGGTVTADSDRTCDDDDRHGNPCTRPAIPGARYCTEHIGDAVDDDAELLKEDGIILADDLTGKVVADTDSGEQFELDVGDDIRLDAVDGDGTRHLTAAELDRGFSRGNYYDPRNDGVADTVALLADEGGARA